MGILYAIIENTKTILNFDLKRATWLSSYIYSETCQHHSIVIYVEGLHLLVGMYTCMLGLVALAYKVNSVRLCSDVQKFAPMIISRYMVLGFRPLLFT